MNEIPFIKLASEIDFLERKDYLYPSKYPLFETFKFLPKPENTISKLLDIGPGHGYFARMACIIGYNVSAIDYDIKRCLLKRWKKWGIEIKQCNILYDYLPWPNCYFDVVSFLHILEHLYQSPAWPLSEIFRILQPGGKLILSTPNAVNLRKRFYVFFGRTNYTPIEVFWEREVFERHNREYTLSEVRYILLRSGFKVDHISFSNQNAKTLLSGAHKPMHQRNYPHSNTLNLGTTLIQRIAIRLYYFITILCPPLRDTIKAVASKPKKHKEIK